jgi:hypothetical protein
MAGRLPAHGNPIYGSGRVCDRLFSLGLVSRTWLANTSRWGEFANYKTWNVKQALRSDPFNLGLKVDPDVANADFGGFTTSGG